ncbi:tetratricopeptide repeat protein [Glutamicibacter sp. Je.9.36]|uniref:tetratricopeptide repeat protein n=1 Tax=Glutamicibacter sp. Je.9.36 TaxID=3142837 RepID=UPI003DA7D817
MESWDQRIEEFWNSANGKRPEQLRTELALLVQGKDQQDPRVLFEVASLHDYLGEEEQAVGPYRAALEAGLEAPRHDEALLQLASTLRNLGQYTQSIELLQQITADSPIFTDAQAFLVLALHDAGQSTEAVQLAVSALARHASLYARAIKGYAGEPASPAASGQR